MFSLKSLGEEWFPKFIEQYLTNLIEIRRDHILIQLREIREKLGKFNLITAYPHRIF